MKALFFALTTIAASFAMAEASTYNVQGMHCAACQSAIESKVCKMDGLKSCKVEVTDKKKQTGKIVLETADGKPVEASKIQELLTAAGEYKLAPEAKK